MPGMRSYTSKALKISHSKDDYTLAINGGHFTLNIAHKQIPVRSLVCVVTESLRAKSYQATRTDK